MAAAITALKQPTAEVIAAATASSDPVIQYAATEMWRYRNAPLPREPASSSSSSSGGSSRLRRVARHRNITGSRANSTNRRRRVAPAQAVDGLPIECGSGTCNSMWGMNRIKAVDLWRQLIAAKKMPLPQAGFLKGMLIDDGVDFSHNDLKGQLDTTNSRTFYSDNGNQPPGGKEAAGQSHGTHCAGTIAGSWSPYDKQADARGIAGVVGPAYGNLVSCNVFGNGEGASDSDIATCIQHAVRVRAHYAINLSLGGPGDIGDGDQYWRDTFAPFCNAGGVALIAAGNGYEVNGVDRGRDVANPYEDGQQHDYPAYAAAFFPDCILAVAAIGQDNDKLTDFSNYGQLVRIAAPGADILSDVSSAGANGWASDVYDGTSMATPHVTGATLLLRNLFPAATNKQVTTCIVSSADRTVKPYRAGETINGGVLNVLAAYNCLAGGSVNPNPPPATQLDCKSAQQVTVPACVNQAAGTENRACSPSASMYCQPVGSSTCQYPFRQPGTVCNTATRAACTGTSADCPTPPPTAKACVDPPYLDDADWDEACYSGIAVGRTCSAQCSIEYDYSGPGYTSTCKLDGTWSKPSGSCQSDFANAIQCEDDCQVANCDGCKCGEDVITGDPACQCNARQGFIDWPYTDDETGEEFSTCSWNLEYAKAYSVRARRNANVLVEFHLMAGFIKICPSVKVITKVTFGVLQICPGDIRAGEYLPLRAAGGQRLGTETCGAVARQGRTLAFAFKVNSPANSRNRCAVLQVETSDGYYQEMLLRYAD
ncbi:hypothetical protein OEZ86_001748 [Tetradesmus obliquus]|nr:hypothetical protein OEZ86_001748 [Tetradesmus obliquus]